MGAAVAAMVLFLVMVGILAFLLKSRASTQQSHRKRSTDYVSRRIEDLDLLSATAEPLTSRFAWDGDWSKTETYADRSGIKLDLNGSILWLPKEKCFLKRVGSYIGYQNIRYSYSPVSPRTLSQELQTQIASGIAKRLINSMCPGLLTNPRYMLDKLAGLARKLTDADLEILADVAASDPNEDVRQDATALLDAHAQHVVGPERGERVS